jgi:hypothetical protein
MENLAEKYAHIKGWGIDADPKNEPTYPMKHYTGDDHQRLNYQRPPLQEVKTEILHSNERPNITAVFGTSEPPSGLSGVLRRMAFKHSESSYNHWLPLLLADRINVWEGIFGDLTKGHIPNVFAERGWKADWNYNRKELLAKVAVSAAVTAAIVGLFIMKRKKTRI